MRKGLVVIFFGFVLVAALALNAEAQMCGCKDEKGGMHKGGMMGGMGHQGMGMEDHGAMMDDGHHLWKQLMDLGLDEKQTEALKVIRSKTVKDMLKKKADKQIAALELKDLLDKDTVDMKAVESLVKKKASLGSEMMIAHIKAHEEMKSVLTPDQRKKLKEKTGHGAGCCGMMGDAEHMPMHERMR